MSGSDPRMVHSRFRSLGQMLRMREDERKRQEQADLRVNAQDVGIFVFSGLIYLEHRFGGVVSAHAS